MECAKIGELLSEYIDGMLEGETKAVVEKHLLTCESCKETLVSLKSLVNELSSLESVEAPKDFLERLHERMEPAFTFGKVIRTLFVPVRIKVPLEFATLAAIAILIFSVSNFQQREKQIAMTPESSTSAWRAKKGTVDTVKITVKEKRYEPEPVSEGVTAQQQERRRETVELVLLLETEVPPGAYAPSSAMETAPPPLKREGVGEEEIGHMASPPAQRVTARAAREVKAKRDDIRQARRPAELEIEERAASKEEAKSPVSDLDETISKVRELVLLTEGKVTSIEYDAETGRSQSIRVEIPAKRYPLFLAKLEEVAALQTPPPTISETDREVIQIRISFISPK